MLGKRARVDQFSPVLWNESLCLKQSPQRCFGVSHKQLLMCIELSNVRNNFVKAKSLNIQHHIVSFICSDAKTCSTQIVCSNSAQNQIVTMFDHETCNLLV